MTVRGYDSGLKQGIVAALSVFLLLASTACMHPGRTVPVSPAAPTPEEQAEQLTGISGAIIRKYLEAAESHEDSLRGASMQVEISADVPKLDEHGKLRALRKISKVGQVTYHVLGFQGSNTIKNQVIARYLQAEQQGQGDQSLAIIPANYKFKYKGEIEESGHDVYLFHISPRKKKIGLFKGEIWLDSKTYLLVMEKGKFVKNPSIFFKDVEFQRTFAIQNGIAIPKSLNSTINVRLIGKVELNIAYSNFSQTPESGEAEGDSAGVTHSRLTRQIDYRSMGSFPLHLNVLATRRRKVESGGLNQVT